MGAVVNGIELSEGLVNTLLFVAAHQTKPIEKWISKADTIPVLVSQYQQHDNMEYELRRRYNLLTHELVKGVKGKEHNFYKLVPITSVSGLSTKDENRLRGISQQVKEKVPVNRLSPTARLVLNYLKSIGDKSISFEELVEKSDGSSVGAVYNSLRQLIDRGLVQREQLKGYYQGRPKYVYTLIATETE